ncbi:MAG: hypothetical protein PHH00_01060 [Candidatus Nanoarchaeia archaeon]|nr:hypothetical protein [Candidatus Nanoarchaeia archaeon]
MKRGMEEREKRCRNPEAFGISGFTLGIMSVVMLLLSPLFGVMTSLVGGVLSYVQLKRMKTKTAKAGLILNIIGLILNIALWVVMLVYLYPLLQQTGLPI